MMPTNQAKKGPNYQVWSKFQKLSTSWYHLIKYLQIKQYHKPFTLLCSHTHAYVPTHRHRAAAKTLSPPSIFFFCIWLELLMHVPWSCTLSKGPSWAWGHALFNTHTHSLIHTLTHTHTRAHSSLGLVPGPDWPQYALLSYLQRANSNKGQQLLKSFWNWEMQNLAWNDACDVCGRKTICRHMCIKTR